MSKILSVSVVSESEAITLYGPTGTRLKEIGDELAKPEIAAPDAIVTMQEARAAVAKISGEYFDAGARLATINAFGFRDWLHEGEVELYEEAARLQCDAVLRGIPASTRDQVLRALTVGPYGDCYKPEEAPIRAESRDFHELQAAVFEQTNADVLWFETVGTIEEAVGMGQVLQKRQLPGIISFIIDKDGRLLSGEDVYDAVRRVDDASGKSPLGYSFNCCPIEGLAPAFHSTLAVGERVLGCYPNASSADPRELCGSEGVQKVDDPKIVGQYLRFLEKAFGLYFVGGCCGHDHESVSWIAGNNDCHLPRVSL